MHLPRNTGSERVPVELKDKGPTMTVNGMYGVLSVPVMHCRLQILALDLQQDGGCKRPLICHRVRVTQSGLPGATHCSWRRILENMRKKHASIVLLFQLRPAPKDWVPRNTVRQIGLVRALC